MYVSLFFIFIGIICLYLGAEFLVKGGKQFGIVLKISPMIIGLTVVSLSTSMPEAVVSFIAQIHKGNGNIALGNIIGSNIANIGLVLGFSALIRNQHTYGIKEIFVMIMVTLVFIVMVAFGVINRICGVVLLLGLIGYLIFEVYNAKKKKMVFKTVPQKYEHSHFINRHPIIFSLIYIITGSSFLVFGGEIFLNGSVKLSILFGISDRAISISLIAIGTSLSELTTSIVATIRKEVSIAVGNVIGSNIFNILFVGGGVATISPMHFSKDLFIRDSVIMLIFVLIFAFMSRTKWRITKIEGFLLLSCYGIYVYQLFD